MNKKQCNYCNNFVEKFLPYRGGSINYLQNFLALDGIGSDVDNFGCPYCGSHDRERHLKMYCDALNLGSKFEGARILHFAPEKYFLSYISFFKPEVHILADLFSDQRNFYKINIEAIPYDDKSFDVVIANHILEKTYNLDAALSEINRVLKPDGIAILQTPFSNKLHHTFEDAGIDSDELRLAFYGQENNVRFFSRNVFNKFSEFLEPNIYQHVDLFPKDIENIHSVNLKEPFFLFRKKGNDVFITPQTDFVNANVMALKSEQEIMANWQSTKPLLSICCIAYNHELFIAKTIESFLIQETDFPFEIIIGEDCSTDATRDIVLRFKRSYPNIITLISSEENVGVFTNFRRTHAACKGDFIAICEGDDYWTDRSKLQKQVDFLCNNTEYVITYSSVLARNSDEDTIIYDYIGGAVQDLESEVLTHATPINTLTVCYRNVIKKFPDCIGLSDVGDLFIWSLLGQYGKGKYIESILPSIYRKHSGGIFSQLGFANKYKMLSMTGYALYLYYDSQEKKLLADYFLQKSVVTVLRVFQDISFEDAVGLVNEMKADLDRRAKLLEIDNYSYENMIKAFSLENLGAMADFLIKQSS